MEDVIPSTGIVAVVLSLSAPPCVHIVHGAIGSALVLGDDLFRDAGSGDWLGFYDWLRTRSGKVVGVRLWVDKPTEQLKAASRCVGVVADERCLPLEIYLGESREFEERLSDDQDFGSNILLMGSRSFAMTFNAPASR